ncbi:uncharacterized protein LOC123610883 isoform X2 [Leopardus geoffroyi]|uniref:uncharacterized protein LOC123610883 isoform X2 n=1 Tax=Leopardus geoffroyi TaxID=46844 RepID=UPI001E25F7A9|nr:uncharacterized protein LOC123610883 isoform X2 [Leopardus geoffroyi]
MGVRRKTEFGGLFFSQLPFLSKSFSLLHFAPPPPPRLLCSPSFPASRGNGRLLGKRSKRRNCLRVQSSKKASSIWRDRVRRARRPLPCPPAAAAAATPASCRRDPEPRPAGVSLRARARTLTLAHTHTHTHTHSLTPATATRARTRPPSPAGNFSGRGSFVAPAAAALRFCESPGVTVRVVCPFGAVLCGSLRARHAGPGRRSPSPEAAAPEVMQGIVVAI